MPGRVSSSATAPSRYSTRRVCMPCPPWRVYGNGAAARAGTRTVTSIPRLRIIDLFLLKKQGVGVRLTAEDEALMMRLTQFNTVEERTIAPGLQADLRQYQKEGFYWLAFLYEHRFGACLADDMGLGKTLQAISLLAAIKEGLMVRKTVPAPACRRLPVPHRGASEPYLQLGTGDRAILPPSQGLCVSGQGTLHGTRGLRRDADELWPRKKGHRKAQGTSFST